MQDDDKKYSTDWEQFPPIEGDGDPLGPAKGLINGLIGGMFLWAVIFFVISLF